MYIFLLYSLTSAQWSKIAELILGYRCATTASFKATYVVLLQIWYTKNIFEFVTERNICDGKENVRDGKYILVTTTNINQKHEVEYNTFNRAQKHSWC
jgi:hypothetical protein